MQDLKSLVDDYNDKKELITFIIEKLRQTIYDIMDGVDFPTVEGSLPQPEESLDSFDLYSDKLVTEWSYIDGYEAIGDRHTTWHIPVEWFEFSSTELQAVLLGIEEEANENHINGKVRRLKMDAEELGFELIKKSQ